MWRPSRASLCVTLAAPPRVRGALWQTIVRKHYSLFLPSLTADAAPAAAPAKTAAAPTVAAAPAAAAGRGLAAAAGRLRAVAAFGSGAGTRRDVIRLLRLFGGFFQALIPLLLERQGSI